MDANEMIERYVHEVGRNLPRHMRADIEMELRSLLHDSLDEMTAGSDLPPTEKMTAELLRDFGKPEVIAAQYRPEQYLIGPQLFPIYKLVVTIVLVIITVVHVAGLVFMLLRGETAVFGQTAWGWFGGYFQSAVLNAGIVTLIFAAIERAQIVNLSELRPKEETWDPLALPPVQDPDRINRFELAFGMMWTVAFIILFNLYPEWIGLADGETVGFSLLAPAFAVHVPWLTLSWSLELALKSAVLAPGRWTRITRWLELALIPLDIYILNRIRTGGDIFTISGLTSLVKAVLGLVIVIMVLDGLYKLYRLVTGRVIKPREIFTSKPA